MADADNGLATSGKTWPRVVSWIGSIWMIGTGLTILFVGRETAFLAIGPILAGLLILPPVVSRVRAVLPSARPMWAPPVAAALVLLICPFLIRGVQRVGPAADVAASKAPVPAAVTVAQKPLSKSETLAEADRLIAQGTADSVAKAVSLMTTAFTDDERRTDPALSAVMKRAAAAKDAADSKGYAAQVEGVYLPQVSRLSASPPEMMSEVGPRIDELLDLAKGVRDGEAYMGDPGARAARAKFKAALSRKQQIILPVLRRGFVKLTAAAMWEHDVEVSAGGDGARVLRFVGGLFASNHNILEFQTSGQEIETKLRFRRIEYRWFRGADQFNYYDLKTPPDGVVATWDGSSFEAAK